MRPPRFTVENCQRTGDGTVGSGSSEAVVTSGPNAREISDDEVPAAEGDR